MIGIDANYLIIRNSRFLCNSLIMNADNIRINDRATALQRYDDTCFLTQGQAIRLY